MREYKNYEFSDDDYKVANLLFENEKAVYSYLATCSGHLWMRTPLSKITSTGEIEQRFRLN